MAFLGFGKEKSGEDAAAQVLAYLEDALRQKSPFVIKAGSRLETGASLHSVSEDGRTFRLLPEQDFKVEKGAKVEFTLIHEGLRMGASTRAAETREGVVVLQFPEALSLMERRRMPRGRFTPKDGASVTALQDLFEGVGITSLLDNLSESGARVRVEKAIAISSEKRLVLGTHLVPVGQSFMVIKLAKLPRCAAPLETKGKVVHLSSVGGELMMGFAFDKPSREVEAALRMVVASRAKPIPDTLPVKVRRPKEPAREALFKQELEPGPAPRKPEPPVELRAPVLDTSGSQMAATLPADVEQRTQLRLSLGPGFRASFNVGGVAVTDIDLLDVSAGGCCLRLSPEECRDLQAGSLLEGFRFLHRDLPNGVLQARVCWILGKLASERAGSAEGRYCLMGVEFLEPSQQIVEGLEAYIAWHIEIIT